MHQLASLGNRESRHVGDGLDDMEANPREFLGQYKVLHAPHIVQIQSIDYERALVERSGAEQTAAAKAMGRQNIGTETIQGRTDKAA